MIDLINEHTKVLYPLKVELNNGLRLDEIKKGLKNPEYSSTAAMELAIYMELKEIFSNGKAIFKHRDSNNDIFRFNRSSEEIEILNAEDYINNILYPDTIPGDLVIVVLTFLLEIGMPLLPEVYISCKDGIECTEIKTKDMDTYILGVDTND